MRCSVLILIHYSLRRGIACHTRWSVSVRSGEESPDEEMSRCVCAPAYPHTNHPSNGSNYDVRTVWKPSGAECFAIWPKVIDEVLNADKLHIVVRRNTVLEFRREALAAILSSGTPQHLWRHAKSRTTILEYCERTKAAGCNC